jgi:N-acetylneuraminate synthase
MSGSFTIASRKVGKNEVPLVIAELGINHGDCLKAAFEIVDAAARAGVEIVKHQTHIIEDEMSSASKEVYSWKRRYFNT